MFAPMTLRPDLLSTALAFLALVMDVRADGQARAAEFEKDIRPLLDTYCFGCHGGEKVKGDVNLEDYKTLGIVQRNPRLWGTVVDQLESGDMPPEKAEKHPAAEERARLAKWLQDNATRIDLDAIPKDPGRVTIRRLNRSEYNNSVRDLFGVDFKPGKNFPADGAGGGGFTNNADTLFLPPILMENYLAAAGSVLDQAFASEKLRKRILFVEPSDKLSAEDAARKILVYFSSFAFRRYATDPEAERFMGLFRKTIEGGGTFDQAMKLALKAVLVSPRFLFRSEKDQPGNAPYRIDDFELASRLSYFLWASMPDKGLLILAAQDKLHEPEILASEVHRMLDDPKSLALAQEFAGQWLGFDELRENVSPDKERFPEFTFALRVSMYQEPLQVFNALVRENRSILELLDSDSTYLNETLAKHYGIPGVTGSQMQRVALPNRQRGGVLGMGGILTATSFPLRTSPVRRGRFVLDELLGTPPPPPPPDAGSLPADDRQPDGLTFRQRLEQHRKRTECAGCHQRMDPIGFGLENFDAIGRWRTENDGKAVDASGELPDGGKFDGPEALRKILLENRDDFTRNTVEKMLAYALGRGVEFYDLPTVQSLSDDLAKNDYRVRTLIHGITKSFPFQNRRNEPIEN
jgi:hypothetical protein